MIKYDQTIDMSQDNSVSIILKNVSPNSKVLEFGPSTGYMTRYMKEKLNCSVYCVELDPEAAEITRKFCEKMIVGDLDDSDWYTQLQEEQFDHIIFSDVLEHLRDPWKVLSKAVSLLTDEGTVLTSIPNISHNTIIMELLQGKFDYRKIGLLDDTHLRFFTRKSVWELLTSAGLSPVRWLGTVLYPPYTEFRQDYTEFPETVSTYLANRDDALVYQFVTISKKSISVDQQEKVTNFAVDQSRVHVGVLEVFWEGAEGFNPDNRIQVKLENTTEFKEYVVTLPQEALNKRLRIDPIDRRALVKVSHISIYQNDSMKYSLTGRSLTEHAIIANGLIGKISDEYMSIYSNHDDLQFVFDDRESFGELDPDKEISLHIRLSVSNNVFEHLAGEIAHLEEAREHHTNRIAELEGKLLEKERHTLAFEQQVVELTHIIEQQSHINTDLLKKEQHHQMEARSKLERIRELEHQILAIQASRGYRLLTNYYRLRDRLLPLGSRRRNMLKSAVSNGFKTLRYSRNYGVKATFIKIKHMVFHSKVSSNGNTPPVIKVKSSQPRALSVIKDSKVSVVIPTKNAGEDLEPLLFMLKNQKGLESVEIIMVDSGSTDGSLEVAAYHGVNVIEILPEDFSHSYSRNLGAEHATGDYILFTTQDALPLNETWIYELLHVLTSNDVSAVSCAETPRENADLFYRVICWNHYRFLEVDQEDRIMSMPDSDDHISLRKNGQLSDIANLIPKKLFDQYKYRFNYAEDLDLGIRLIKDGRKIAFLGTTRIIHSHLRNAFYFLKRGYVDNLFLSDIFPDFKIPMIKFEHIVHDILRTACVVNQIVEKMSMREQYEINEFIEMVRLELKIGTHASYSFDNLVLRPEYWDADLIKLLQEMKDQSALNHYSMTNHDILPYALEGYMNITFDYLKHCYEYLDITVIEEFNACIVKEFAQLAGAHLAYSYLKNNDKSEYVQLLNGWLVKGV